LKFSVDVDIARARTINKSFYLDESVFQLSKKKIFGNCWYFISDTSSVKKAGDCLPVDLLPGFLDEPLLLTRDVGGKVHLLSNVCTHRANMVVQHACNLPHLRCRYHGRVFNHDGSFRSMPEFKEVLDFPNAKDDLQSLPMAQWGKLLFGSLKDDCLFGQYFGDMINRLHWLPVEEFVFRPELSKDFIVKAHWALYCENYLEGFHIPFVHPGLNAVIDFRAYTTELFPFSSLQLGIAKENDACFDLPSTSIDFGKKVAGFYFFVFPNLMFNFYPWGLSLNIIEPAGPSLTRVRFLNYVWKEELLNEGAGSGLDKVEMEDEEVVESVQQGVRSSFYEQGRYSVTQEKGTHHFHRLICDFMN
jgi:choline monooxygenase